MTDPVARPPRRTLASTPGGHNGVRWVLEEEPGGGLVLSPRAGSWVPWAAMGALYAAFGLGWTVLVPKLGAPPWAAAVGLPLMIVVTVLVIGFYRAAGRAEVARGPVMTWSPATQTLSLPRSGASIPRERVVALELFGRWERANGRLARSRVLDLVVRDDSARTTTRLTLLADAARMAPLAEALARHVGIPLERIH